jgi:urease accessory protein
VALAADLDRAGWAASLDLGFVVRAGRTVLAERRRSGPLAVQRPFYPESGVCHVYLLHPPGGVAGGDRLDVAVRVGQGAHALITTPGATKFYRSSGPRARVRQRLSVAPGGILEWLPQEGIFFPGADIQVATELDLQGDARLFAWELQTLGRPALGERFSRGRADLGLALSRDGRPLLRERLRIEGTGGLDGPSTLRGFPICGTLIAGPATVEDLCMARELVGNAPGFPAAVTLVDGFLVARCLAQTLEPVQRVYRALWGEMRPRLLDVAACAPRIWAT